MRVAQARELYAALDRFRENRRAAPAAASSSALVAELASSMRDPRYRERLMSKSGDKLVPIAVAEVSFFESIDRITWAYDAGGGRVAVPETLDRLEELLNPKAFRRLDRAVIASAGSVERLTPYSNSRYRAHLTGHAGEPVVVSRERVSGIKDWLGGG